MLDRESSQPGDAERRDHGQQDLERRLVPRDQPEHADYRSEDRRGCQLAKRGLQDQRDADRQDRLAGDARDRTNARSCLADFVQAAKTVGRPDGTLLCFAQQAVERGDLIETRTAGQRSRQLECRRLAAAQADEQGGREGADAGVVDPVYRRDDLELLLHGVHGLTGRVHRRP
jgi:hypothetical protein